jgi:WD repeat-containing protein 68
MKFEIFFCFSGEFAATATIDHPYPCTKLMWIPDTAGRSPDLIATSGDYLRIFKVDPQNQNGARQECLLNNNREKVEGDRGVL